MESRERKQTRGTDSEREAHETERRKHAPAIEHDQDSEPPRTARAPGSDEIDEEWGRQEGC